MTSTVMFYEPEEEKVEVKIDVTGVTAPTQPVAYRYKNADDKRRLFRIKAGFNSKSIDSEGYASVTDSDFSNRTTSDSDAKSKRSSWKRHSSKQSSFGVFDFPSFDELFEGETKVNISDIYQKQQKEICESEIEAELKPEQLVSQIPEDSNTEKQNICVASLSGSTGFFGFRRRLAKRLHDKYCIRCMADGLLFSAVYVMYGMFITCAGVMCLVNCIEESMVAAYLLVDGLLSVFMFPILTMGWSKRVGGCVEDTEKLGKGIVWGVTLVVRILTLISGSMVLNYRAELLSIGNLEDMCFLDYTAMLIAVLAAWIMVIFLIFVPTLTYLLMYFCTVCIAK